MRRGLLLLASLVIVGCGSPTVSQQSSARAPAVTMRPPTDGVYADWVGQWQSRLPAVVSLYRGEHRGEVAGSYYSRVKVFYPVFNPQIGIKNRTGYRLTTGTDLYVVQTAAGATGKDNGLVLDVIGGSFRETPLEDYVGAVEVRGSKITPDVAFGLIDSVDSSSRHGFFGSVVDLILSVGGDGNILQRRFEQATSFGSADDGRSVEIDGNDLQLTVIIRSEYVGSVYVVSPALEFRNAQGDAVAFRYLSRFDKGSDRPSESTLLPLDDTSLLPILKDAAQPLWKRVFAAGWAGRLRSPESAAVLATLAAIDGRQPAALRRSALFSLGLRGSSFDLIKGVAQNRKEPAQLRLAATWALGKSNDPSAPLVLKALLDEDDKAVSAQAIDSLAELKAKDALDLLVAMLAKQGAREVRSNMMAAIGQLGDQATADKLSAMAKQNAELRRLIIPVLPKLAGGKAVPALRDLFASNGPKGTKDDDWPVRMDVCAALSGLDDSEALAVLQKASGDANDYVRAAAIQSIASVGTDERRNLILGLVDNSNTENARSAIRALGANPSPQGKAKILEVLKGRDKAKEVRWAAIEALGEYHDADVSRDLLAALPQETDANLKADTLTSLSMQTSRHSLAAIERGLMDNDGYVAGRAAGIWRKLNGIKACGATLNALVVRKDEDAERLVGALTLPGCRDKMSFEKVVGRFGAGDANYDAALTRLLKSWSGQDFGTDKQKWLAWSNQNLLR